MSEFGNMDMVLVNEDLCDNSEYLTTRLHCPVCGAAVMRNGTFVADTEACEHTICVLHRGDRELDFIPSAELKVEIDKLIYDDDICFTNELVDHLRESNDRLIAFWIDEGYLGGCVYSGFCALFDISGIFGEVGGTEEAPNAEE